MSADATSGGIATPVLVALISAVSALIVALANIAWQYVQARRARREQEERDRQTQKDREALEQLREEVDTRKAQRDARLDYEYEARKELYKSSEPLLFQLHELAQIAWFRTLSLARTASLGHLDARESWLGGPGYYMLSTIYALLAPLAVFRLLQRRLTFLDIGLDESVGRRYRIARALYSMLAEHHDLARIEPTLPYDPHGPEADARRKRSPQRYWVQGMPGHALDEAVDAMIRDLGTKSERVVSYAEFRHGYQELEASGSLADHSLAHLLFLFTQFHPKTRPVLWRLLVTQALLCERLIKARPPSLAAWADIAEFDLLSEAGRRSCDWRQASGEASDQHVLVEPFEAAQRYLSGRLRDLSVGLPVEASEVGDQPPPLARYPAKASAPCRPSC